VLNFYSEYCVSSFKLSKIKMVCRIKMKFGKFLIEILECSINEGVKVKTILFYA